MYSTSHSVSAPMNGMGGELADGSGTINPAALNNAAPLPSTPVPAPNSSPRGVKRSRSPDQYGDVTVEGEHEDDEQGRRKRGRPPKTPRPSGNGTSTTTSQQTAPVPAPAQTPQMSSQSLPQQSAVSPPQTSPPTKTTPTKSVVKALPTVRDHTTDQLNADGDEYIPKEFDEAGEKKVDALGYPQDGREYKCRTFRVPNRGNKLFMLATECARVLGYRDSYLLFNKNRSLYKIIATQAEKDDLIQQDILPYSYRSRQIAIVTAKSMFRQFGSRVIVNGRRVRDDYWESKARKQGFTEDDLAGEKRPGGAKARDAAAAEAAATAGMLPNLGHGDVVYSNTMEGLPHGLPPGLSPHAATLAPLPMIHLTPTTDDPRLREFSSIPRPRQEITGQPYQDRTQPSSASEILNQASQTADFNKILNSQRAFRQKGLEEFYASQRDIPVTTASQSQPGQIDVTAPVVSQALQSPQMSTSSGLINPSQAQQQNVLSQPASMLTSSQGGYSQQPHQQTHVAQSPVRGVPQGIRPDVLQQRTSNPALSSATSAQTAPFVYPSQTQQMWGQPPPQPQPMTASPHMGMPQYASPMHPQQSPSPLPQQQQPHPSQSPHSQPRPAQQMPQSMQMHPQVPQAPGMASLGYQGGYSNMGTRAMYPSGQNPNQQFLQQPGMNMGMGAGVGMPGWPSPAGGHMQPGQPQQGQSGSPLGGWSGY